MYTLESEMKVDLTNLIKVLKAVFNQKLHLFCNRIKHFQIEPSWNRTYEHQGECARTITPDDLGKWVSEDRVKREEKLRDEGRRRESKEQWRNVNIYSVFVCS